jgi:hypothetical protein
MDEKSRILIVGFLGRIQVASRKRTERQVGRQSRNMSGTLASAGYLVFFIKITGNARR